MRPEPDDWVLLGLEADTLGVVLGVLPGQRLVRGPEERILEEPPPGQAALADVLVVLDGPVGDPGTLEEALHGHAHQPRLCTRESRKCTRSGRATALYGSYRRRW